MLRGVYALYVLLSVCHAGFSDDMVYYSDDDKQSYRAPSYRAPSVRSYRAPSPGSPGGFGPRMSSMQSYRAPSYRAPSGRSSRSSRSYRQSSGQSYRTPSPGGDPFSGDNYRQMNRYNNDGSLVYNGERDTPILVVKDGDKMYNDALDQRNQYHESFYNMFDGDNKHHARMTADLIKATDYGQVYDNPLEAGVNAAAGMHPVGKGMAMANKGANVARIVLDDRIATQGYEATPSQVAMGMALDGIKHGTNVYQLGRDALYVADEMNTRANREYQADPYGHQRLQMGRIGLFE